MTALPPLATPMIAAVNCADIALSVFYSRLLTRCGIFCSYELLSPSVECCVLLRSLNLERW